MNLEIFFNALTTAWLVGEILLAILTRTRQGQGKLQDRGTQIILWIVITASLWIEGWIHSHFPIDMPGSHTWLRPVALAILILGLAVRIVAIVTLGRAFSVNVPRAPASNYGAADSTASSVTHPISASNWFSSPSPFTPAHGPASPSSSSHRLWPCYIASTSKRPHSASPSAPITKTTAAAPNAWFQASIENFLDCSRIAKQPPLQEKMSSFYEGQRFAQD
jgi:hypothetical protein